MTFPKIGGDVVEGVTSELLQNLQYSAGGSESLLLGEPEGGLGSTVVHLVFADGGPGIVGLVHLFVFRRLYYRSYYQSKYQILRNTELLNCE